jgi:hypothetical protein
MGKKGKKRRAAGAEGASVAPPNPDESGLRAEIERLRAEIDVLRSGEQGQLRLLNGELERQRREAWAVVERLRSELSGLSGLPAERAAVEGRPLEPAPGFTESHEVRCADCDRLLAQRYGPESPEGADQCYECWMAEPRYNKEARDEILIWHEARERQSGGG